MSTFSRGFGVALKIDTHFLVPKHSIVPRELYTELFAKLRIGNADQLPQISKNDPAIKRMRAEKGLIIEVKRKSMTAGSYTYYRVVK